MAAKSPVFAGSPEEQSGPVAITNFYLHAKRQIL
jgi:hypothetical protein